MVAPAPFAGLPSHGVTSTEGRLCFVRAFLFKDAAIMQYLYLLFAIIGEAIGTTLMKESNGFTKPVPTVIMTAFYIWTFYFLSLALRLMPTGVAYAIWSGVGVVLITSIAWIYQGQKLDAAAIGGMALIVAGSVVLNLFSKTAAH